MAQETRNAYGQELAKLIKEREDIVVLDADLTKSTKTVEAKNACPERHFNAGIAEANMMGMAAGLAASGKTVFASSFAVFAAGRAFEIIRNSICYPNLNVKVCATHAGLSVGEDGASHQSIEDVSLMRTLPNMHVFVPCDQYETKAVIDYVADLKGPCYVRLGRGKVEDVYTEKTKFDFTKVKVLKKGTDVALFAMGLMVQEALKAAEALEAEGISASVINVTCLKPIDRKGIQKALKGHKMAFACEEHNIIGGLFSAVAEIAVQEPGTPVYPIGVEDTFGESGKAKDVLKKYGMTAENIVKVVKAKNKKKK
ncbi:MAG: transketolase family protein [Erysipelotrichaceae bacterium]|nr:transketolase family protein [Erysipelotrichaceae bacterium]MBR3167752.1 transketolase family protein [Erysipelotrichaceae bacterium]